MGQVVVLMTEAELAEARAHGKARYEACRARGQVSRCHPSVAQDALAAAAEVAVARALGLPRDTSLEPQRKGAGDVGPFEVRHTVHHLGHLCLQPHDAPEAPYLLVTGMPPHLTIRGWMGGKEGKQPWYWVEGDPRFPRPCYAIPQAALHDLGDLDSVMQLWRWSHAWDGSIPQDPEREVARLPAAVSARRALRT